jgi:preprotein translocase subunit Sec63
MKEVAKAKEKLPATYVKTGAQISSEIFDIQATATFCYEVENMLQNVESVNHYTILGVERCASSADIESAYRQIVGRFAPENHALLTNQNFILQAELEKIIARVDLAYSILSNQTLRKEYNLTLRNSGKLRLCQI